MEVRGPGAPLDFERSTAIQAILVSLASFALYLGTLAPGLLWGDDAELQRLAVLGQVAAGERSYALWTALVLPFTRLPFGDPAWRVTLACAVFAALAVGTVFVLLRETDCPPRIALAGSAALAVSHTFWLHAVRTEVYSLLVLALALATTVLVAWHRRPGNRGLLAAGLALAGLAVLVHPLALTFVPGFVLLVLVTRPRDRLAVPALVVAGALLGALALLRGSALGDTGYSPRKLVADLAQVRGRDLVLWAGFLVYQFLLFGALAVPGAIATWRRDRALGAFTLLAFAGSVGLALVWRVPDQYVFYLPSYLVFVVWIGQGATWLAARAHGGRRFALALFAAALLPVPVYALVPGVLDRAGTALLSVRTLPHRDNHRFFFFPPKNGDDGARRFGEKALAALPADAALLADWVPLQTLRYLQEVEGQRPDVLLAETGVEDGQAAWVMAQSRTRPVFLADDEARYYDLEGIGRSFTLEPAGPLYRLVPRPH